MSTQSDHPESGPATATAPPPPPPPPAPSGISTPAPGDKSGRAWLGVLLIAAGVFLLVARFIPFVSWANFWPLILIVAGLVSAFTPGKEGWSVPKMFDGFVTVAFGGVFLAITLGYVGWGVWGTILSLWPVLLISLGFDLLARALHTTWLKVIGSLLVIAALGYAVVTYAAGAGPVRWTGSATGSRSQAVSFSEPVGSVDEAELVLEGGVAQMNVTGGSELLEVTGTSPWGDPVVDVRRDGTKAAIDATLGGEDATWVWPQDASANLDVTLAEDVLWDIRLNTGVASVRADLTDVPVRSLDLRPGVADCEVRLGEVPDGVDEATAEVRSGVSSVVLRIPESAPSRVEIESGISSTNVRGDFERTDSGAWQTKDFEEARAAGDAVWIVTVRSGVGAITVETY